MSDLIENENGRIGEIDAPAGAREKNAGFDADVVENAEIGIPETPSFQDASLLDAHAEAGHDLIPIDGKVPVERGWTKAKPINLAKARARMRAGKNIGVRLRAVDLVVDVDPRHFEDDDDPVARLWKDFALPECPFVRTGGGGLHFYLRKPADVEVVDRLAAYPGIEFKSKGRQVVAAGSVHPSTGLVYALDDDVLAMSLSEAPDATTALLEAIRKPTVETSNDEPGAIDPETLAEWLESVDPTEFKDQRKWQDMMMACHHATNGAGVDEFIAWSTSDPEYSDHGEIIRRRWNTLGAIPNGITVRTLIAHLPQEKRREAVEMIDRVEPEDDFADDLDAESDRSRSVWDDWVFVADAMQFVRREDGKKYRTDQWKALYAGLNPDGEVLNAIWKGRVPMRKFESLVYLPEKAEFPNGENGSRYNIWRKAGVEAKPGDVTPFPPSHAPRAIRRLRLRPEHVVGAAGPPLGRLHSRGEADDGRRAPVSFELLQHQNEGVDFLTGRGVGLLAFEQGLGKTFVAIEAFRRLLDAGRADKLLVICPNSLKRNWVAEFAKFAPTVSVDIAEGLPKKRREMFRESRARVIITSYETARSETTALLALVQRQRTVLVLDESHAVFGVIASETK